MRKFVILVLVVLFSFSNGYMADIEAADNYGRGTEPSIWAAKEVNEARNKGLLISELDGNFRTNISREQFCKLIVNMVEKTISDEVEINIENPFDDVDDEDIIKANQLGIVNGVSDTEFAPNKDIKRQEIAAMMMRAARVIDEMRSTMYVLDINTEGISFADEKDIASWAIKDIKALNKLKLMKGVGKNMIEPMGKATVEQSILLSLRLFNGYLDFIKDSERILANLDEKDLINLKNPIDFDTHYTTFSKNEIYNIGDK